MTTTDSASGPSRDARHDPDRYLSRIGLDPSAARAVDRETLARLQRAHVTSVPFENLAITGDPHGPRDGDGVSLYLPDLYEKVVERERGGFCFELNGLFGWLLDRLGFDADRIAARVVGSDGDARPPANHHSHLVSLDREYVVDVGMGVPTMRRPLALDGAVREDGAGVEWRVVESGRPGAEYLTQFRNPDDDEWTDRYLFDTTPRKLSHFEATCEYLEYSPDSPFTGDPVVSIATEWGHYKLSDATLKRIEGGDGTEYEVGEGTEREVGESEWHDVLAEVFGMPYERDDRRASPNRSETP